MAETKIEWTATPRPDGTMAPGYTFNPVLGCQKVGLGCDNCYAEGWAKRSGLVEWGPKAARRVTSDSYWRQLRKWDALAAAAGEQRKVFCASLADVMDNAWPAGVRRRLGVEIEATPNLIYLLLTKRIGNAERFLPEMFPSGVPANVWLGVTVVNQEEADRDIPKLLAIKDKFGICIVFLSMEPLLGPVNLTSIRVGGETSLYRGNALTGDGFDGRCLDLVIVGGESGPGARPMHPDWPRGLRDQCVAAGVAYFHKQNGMWLHESASDAERWDWDDADARGLIHCWPDGSTSIRLRKHDAGRLLDGRTWDQMPGVRHA